MKKFDSIRPRGLMGVIKGEWDPQGKGYLGRAVFCIEELFIAGTDE